MLQRTGLRGDGRGVRWGLLVEKGKGKKNVNGADTLHLELQSSSFSLELADQGPEAAELPHGIQAE